MRIFYLLILFIIKFPIYNAFASAEISEVYTKARGNNVYEAKLQALDKGMFRAFQLFANKLSIYDKKIENIPPHVIKAAIKDLKIRDEKIEHFTSSAFYAATLEIYFNQVEINNIILQYASEDTKNRFYEAIVIPVFKINNIFKIIENKKEQWIALWDNSKYELSNYMLFYPKITDGIINKIDAKKILNYDYQYLSNNLPFKLFKSIIITIGEFFTQKDTGETYILVKNYIKTKENTKIEQQKYYITGNNLDKIKAKLVKDFVQRFGRKSTAENMISRDPTDSILQLEHNDENKASTYIFKINPTYPEEIDDINKKLSKLKNINYFKILKDNIYQYKIIINAELTLQELAITLFENNLSYYDNDKNKIIINLEDKKGEL